jgi:hypothetical protein
LMMASIFFTERLPGISILQTAALFRRCARCASYPIACPDGQPAKLILALAGEHHDPERILPRFPKSRVYAKLLVAPVFGMLSDF